MHDNICYCSLANRYGAVGTSHQLQNGPYPNNCTVSADQPSNQTTKEPRVETCSLHKSLPLSCGLISHSYVWPQCWAQKQTHVTVTEDCAYASEFPDMAEDLDMAKLWTTAQTATGLYEWGPYLWLEGFLGLEFRVIMSERTAGHALSLCVIPCHSPYKWAKAWKNLSQGYVDVVTSYR